MSQPIALGQDSLVLYKNRPARVRQMDKKMEIEVQGGQTLSVRLKDVTPIHPGPVRNLAELQEPAGEVTTAWELLAGETTTLPELAELIYGAYTPATAWFAWQLVGDGLYFSGSPAMIAAHEPEWVAAEQSARKVRVIEERAWSAFLARLEAGRFAPEDGRYLEDVVSLALGQQETSRTLRALGRSESAANAHALLLAIGYWDCLVNPYPQRLGVPTAPPQIALPALPEEPRRDLTHLTALAIDDEGNLDPDDALSLEDGRLWVHIADVAALIPPGSVADLEARARGANLYLPEGTVPMLPPKTTEILALGLTEISPALSFGLDLAPTGEIMAVEIVPSWVRVVRFTYEEVEARIEESPFRELYQIAQRYEARRRQNGAIHIDLPEVKVQVTGGQVLIRPLPALRSRDLVREAMLMTGEAVARFALEHDIPIPFTTQDAPFTPEDMPATAVTPSSMFALRRTLRSGQQKGAPAPHAGLGMDLYVQCTSPLRRYLDLVVHQQLRAYLHDEEALGERLNAQAVMARVGAVDAVVGAVRRAERLSITHWCMVYLQQRPEWRGEGIIVDKRGARDVILIPSLALETQIYQRHDAPLDSRVSLALGEVNLPELEAHFQRLG